MAEITLRKARTIISKALARAAEGSLKPLAVCVLDAGGHLKAFERQDGASIGRFDVARGKASGALQMGLGSRALNERAEKQAYFLLATGRVFPDGLVPVPGGVLVRDRKGATIGAVGISGDTSDNDEAAAMAGIEAAGFIGDPG
jgi:uncharacterized protein GlcG (DUF336 family)